MKNLIISHDLGTSGNKTCLFDSNGEIINSAISNYQTYYPNPGWAEQNPEDWWEAVKIGTKKVMIESKVSKKDIAAISFSAHSLGCTPVDKNGNLLRDKNMIWMDSRSTKEAEYILSKYDSKKHHRVTGDSFDIALYPCSKIMWLRNNEPDVYKNTYKFIGTKEYIIFKMTGELGITDTGEAGFSGLYNINTYQYEEELLEITKVDRDKLCDPHPSTEVIGSLTKAAADELLLESGIPVVLGSTDNICAVMGSGGIKKGIYVNYLGTSGWIGCSDDKPILDEEVKANVMLQFNKTYFTSIHSHSAGAAFDWMIKNMCKHLEYDAKKLDKDIFKLADELAAKINPGSDNVFFMPSMYSGGTIFSSPSLRGAYIGLLTNHSNGHLIRSAMEGVGFDLMMGTDFFSKKGMKAKEVRLIGGGANSRLWRSILASMYDAPIAVPKNNRSIGGLGAAILAGLGAGIIKDINMIDDIIVLDEKVKPDKSITKIYSEFLPIYKELYKKLIPVYEQLTDLQIK